MKPAAATTERIARLVLLVCTLCGFAALHTVGHAAVVDHHTADVTVTVSGSAFLTGTSPVHDDDCAGDGCTHPMAMPADSYDCSSRLGVCVTILSVIAIGALLVAQSVLGLADRSATNGGSRLSPRFGQAPAWGLAVTAVAVIRT